MKIKNLIVESDSATSVSLIGEPLILTHHYAAILKEIKFWTCKEWNVRFIHTYGEGNGVTDRMTFFAHSLDVGRHIFVRPSPGVTFLLYTDFIGTVFSRRAAV